MVSGDRKLMKKQLSDVGQKAKAVYESLINSLEAENAGKAIAIHTDSKDYAIADTHTAARRLLEKSHPEGAIVTLTIGPPTTNDFAVAYRILAGETLFFVLSITERM